MMLLLMTRRWRWCAPSDDGSIDRALDCHVVDNGDEPTNLSVLSKQVWVVSLLRTLLWSVLSGHFSPNVRREQQQQQQQVVIFLFGVSSGGFCLLFFMLSRSWKTCPGIDRLSRGRCSLSFWNVALPLPKHTAGHRAVTAQTYPLSATERDES